MGGWFVEAVFVAMCVGLQRPLARKSMERACDIPGRIVQYETDNIDEHGLARGSVEIFAVRLCAGVVGPVFCYFIAGLPVIFVCCVTTALADALAHATEKYGEVVWGASAPVRR